MARRIAPRGMTLIEVLIATALTMLIMLALAQGFKTTSQSISAGRARLTGSDQLRSISNLIRSDLQGLTVSTQVHPQSAKTPLGYFVYYDGPISDSTAMLFNYVPSAVENEEKFSASRWSDIDDVLMFTSKAPDGHWFYGRVPLALMKIHSGATSVTLLDWITDVTIASEYAEIAWFMRPLNEIGMLNNPDPQSANGNYSYSPSSTPVNDVAPVVDLNGDNIPDPDGMPDRIALCRRVLLIRPDLDIAITKVSGLANDPQLIAAPMPIDTSDADSFRYQMRFAYQRTDLSVRKQWDSVNSRFVLKTNSLGDLQRPENRFAHYCLPATGSNSSLPVLALTNEANSNGNYLTMTNLVMSGAVPANDRGFIPAAFCRTNLVSTGNASYSPQFTQEEIVASNIVGFDVRGYDSSAMQLYTPGVDGKFGSLTNANPTIAQIQLAAGEAGFDDLIVGPSDPGYANMISSQIIVPANSGTFVDLAWGIRVVNQIKDASGSTFGLSPANHPNVRGGALSGYEPLGASIIDSLSRSGKFSTTYSILQPTFDTFTDFYESDGNLQVAGIHWNGLVSYGANLDTNAPLPDRGINGIDDNSNGVIDEEAERDTSPPFRYAMPAVQVKLRIQDQTAGTLQELSMIHSLQGN
ncbi:MAG: type II secretion system protein J [Planctomycetota bacterium]